MGGHNNWFNENDFRDISQKMFHARPDEREMICSEWAAKCIASSIDQLNRLTSYDLQSAGLAPENQEAKVLTNPIPKNEIMTKIHPERLVTLLQEADCIDRVHHDALEKIINTENKREKAKSVNINEQLPRKMISILKSSRSEKEFVEHANKNIKSYLKMSGVNFVPTVETDKQLSSLYQEHTKKPEGVIEVVKYAMNKVLEYCHIRTENSQEKEKISKIIDHVNTGIKNLQHEQMKEIVQNAAEVNKALKEGGLSHVNTDQARINYTPLVRSEPRRPTQTEI